MGSGRQARGRLRWHVLQSQTQPSQLRKRQAASQRLCPTPTRVDGNQHHQHEAEHQHDDVARKAVRPNVVGGLRCRQGGWVGQLQKSAAWGGEPRCSSGSHASHATQRSQCAHRHRPANCRVDHVAQAGQLRPGEAGRHGGGAPRRAGAAGASCGGPRPIPPAASSSTPLDAHAHTQARWPYARGRPLRPAHAPPSSRCPAPRSPRPPPAPAALTVTVGGRR